MNDHDDLPLNLPWSSVPMRGRPRWVRHIVDQTRRIEAEADALFGPGFADELLNESVALEEEERLQEYGP